MITHKHHVIPRHAGGTDEPSNLFECSVEEHAELHFALYLEHGRWQDWIAFHVLAGWIDAEDASMEAIRQSSRRTCIKRNAENNPMNNPENVAKAAASNKKWWAERPEMRDYVAERQRKAITGMKRTEEQKEKSRAAAKKRWDDPEARKRQAEKIKKSWEKRRTK